MNKYYYDTEDPSGFIRRFRPIRGNHYGPEIFDNFEGARDAVCNRLEHQIKKLQEELDKTQKLKAKDVVVVIDPYG